MPIRQSRQTRLHLPEFVYFPDGLVYAAHLPDKGTEADEETYEKSYAEPDEARGICVCQLMAEKALLPTEGESPEDNERHCYEHPQTLIPLESEQPLANGQQVVAFCKEAWQLTIDDDVESSFDNHHQEQEAGEVPGRANPVDYHKHDRHEKQADDVCDEAGPGEDAQAGAHRAAHEPVVDDFLLVKPLLEEGKLTADFIYFVLGNVVVICLSFHNCILLSV